jgi:hypothetical protein
MGGEGAKELQEGWGGREGLEGWKGEGWTRRDRIRREGRGRRGREGRRGEAIIPYCKILDPPLVVPTSSAEYRI